MSRFVSRKEYFDRGSYNLFFVDWSELARAPCYPSAVHNTKYAGECIGQLVNRIRDTGTENIHIIGFSLGAHVGKMHFIQNINNNNHHNNNHSGSSSSSSSCVVKSGNG